MKKYKITKYLKRLFLIVFIPVLLIIIPVGIHKLYESIRSSFLTDVEKRQEDIDRLTYIMQNEFAGYNVLEGTKAFNKQIAHLRKLANDSNTNSKVFNLELLKAVAAFKDPHTAVANTKELFNNFFPYRATWSNGDFYLTSGTVDVKWLGAKIIRFDTTDARTVFHKLNQYTSSPNESGTAAFMSLFQSNADILYHENIGNNRNRITLKLSLSSGETTEITFNSITHEAVNALNNYNRLSTKHKENKPLWKTNTEKNYWFKFVEDDKLFYLRYSYCVDQGNINAFWDEVFSKIEKTNPDTFVLDLRGNPGGDTQNHARFLTELVKNKTINTHGKFYTLIDGKTGSAAVSLASNLERLTETILVGEKTIDLPNTTADPTYYTLPHSRIKIVVPNLYHLNTHIYDKRDAVIPDIIVAQKIDDENYAKDEVLDEIKKIQNSNSIEERQKAHLPNGVIGTYSFSPIRNLTISKDNSNWMLNIDGLLKATLIKKDSTIYSSKGNVKLIFNDSLFQTLTLDIHGSKVIAKRIDSDSTSIISNIEKHKYDIAKKQLLKLKSASGLPYYIDRPLLQTKTYDTYLNSGFDKAYELNQVTKTLFPDDPVVSLVDYELYQYDSNHLGQFKSVFPIVGKLMKRYYKVITTDAIMNDDYNPFIGN